FLENATSPVIIAGNGVHMSKSYNELKDFASAISAPIVTTYRGKSAIEETHKLSAGMMGDYGQLAANKMVSQADLIIALGTRLGPSDTMQENKGLIDPEKQKIIQFDLDAQRASWTFPVDL